MCQYVKVCAWCQAYLQTPPSDTRGRTISLKKAESEGFSISHGICRSCYDRLMNSTDKDAANITLQTIGSTPDDTKSIASSSSRRY